MPNFCAFNIEIAQINNRLNMPHRISMTQCNASEGEEQGERQMQTIATRLRAKQSDTVTTLMSVPTGKTPKSIEGELERLFNI